MVNFFQEVEIESSRHVCAPSCSRSNAVCNRAPEEDIIDETEVDVLNTSDQNENEIDVSAEIESLDGDNDLEFEAVDKENDVAKSPIIKNKRKINLEYVLVESFDNKESLDQFWNERVFKTV